MRLALATVRVRGCVVTYLGIRDLSEGSVAASLKSNADRLVIYVPAAADPLVATISNLCAGVLSSMLEGSA